MEFDNFHVHNLHTIQKHPHKCLHTEKNEKKNDESRERRWMHTSWCCVPYILCICKQRNTTNDYWHLVVYNFGKHNSEFEGKIRMAHRNGIKNFHFLYSCASNQSIFCVNKIHLRHWLPIDSREAKVSNDNITNGHYSVYQSILAEGLCVHLCRCVCVCVCARAYFRVSIFRRDQIKD